MIKENDLKEIEIIPSKSDVHRALICAALAKIQAGKSNVLESSDGLTKEYLSGLGIEIKESSADIDATTECLNDLMNPENDRVGADLYCRESGSTLRFLLPVVGALGKRGIFHPMGRLSKRPLSPLYEELCDHGMRITEPGSVPLIAEGQLMPGEYNIPGDISSQFVSGLLFALPILDGDSRIIVSGELQSAGYVDMTLKTIEQFGIKIIRESIVETIADTDNTKDNAGEIFIVPGNQKYIAPEHYQIEGDWSNGAFWLAAGILGESPIKVNGLDLNSAQRDKEIVNVIREMGGDIEIEYSDVDDSDNLSAGVHSEYFVVRPSRNKLSAITFDAGQTPDMIPVVALLATQAKGVTRIINAGRLRAKESDRLHSISSTLRALGADIEELPEGLVIKGSNGLKGGTCESFADHRIAMMAAIASLVSENKVELIGWDAAFKSYPTFYDRLAELGLDGNLERV